MKSKIITAALVAIAGCAIADLIRAALYPNAATIAVESGRSDGAASPVAITHTPTSPNFAVGSDAASPVISPDATAPGISEPGAGMVVPVSADAPPRERHIVIQPGSDLVVIETNEAPTKPESRTAIIPASIGEAAASDDGVMEASATSSGPMPPRLSNALPASADVAVEPAVVESGTQN